MPTVICSQNQHVTHWRSRRGGKRPQTCPQCGASCDVAEYDVEIGAWKPAPQKRRVRCSCGRGVLVTTDPAGAVICRRCAAIAARCENCAGAGAVYEEWEFDPEETAESRERWGEGQYVTCPVCGGTGKKR